MVDGTYTVRAKTPVGKHDGTIKITSAGDTCQGVLTLGGKTKVLEGPLNGNTASFAGTVKMPFPIGKVDFTIEGVIDGDTLKGVCRTKKFHFDIDGERIA